MLGREGPMGAARYDALLARARALAADVLAPRANAADQADRPPVKQVRALAAAGLLGLTVPARYGGHEAPRAVVRAYTEILAAACGLTTFVQQQHLSACRLIAGGTNAALQADCLPAFAAGARLCGVAFSHLRRPGPPLLRATPAPDGGWVLDGTAPWFTGWGLMDEVVLGGTLPDGRLLYVLAPLDAGPALTPSPPLRLCAFNASATVALHCRGLRVGAERHVKTTARADLATADRGGVLDVTPQTFGVALAASALVRALAAERDSTVLRATADALDAEREAARQAVETWLAVPSAPEQAAGVGGGYAAGLRLRAGCLALAVRAAHAAVAATGGGANARDQAAQRLYREAMAYTLLMQTADVQAATLDRLAADAARATAAFTNPSRADLSSAASPGSWPEAVEHL
ncbi:MAG TPA: acyl-CoA dehydrogenase family protein [Chloroflexota bacterium]|jgi:alkylation response protein AidB-like acyl-CoA dehydrogenase